MCMATALVCVCVYKEQKTPPATTGKHMAHMSSRSLGLGLFGRRVAGPVTAAITM